MKDKDVMFLIGIALMMVMFCMAMTAPVFYFGGYANAKQSYTASAQAQITAIAPDVSLQAQPGKPALPVVQATPQGYISEAGAIKMLEDQQKFSLDMASKIQNVAVSGDVAQTTAGVIDNSTEMLFGCGSVGGILLLIGLAFLGKAKAG